MEDLAKTLFFKIRVPVIALIYVGKMLYSFTYMDVFDQEINRNIRADITFEHSAAPENKHKNRYTNIIACEHKLSSH